MACLNYQKGSNALHVSSAETEQKSSTSALCYWGTSPVTACRTSTNVLFTYLLTSLLTYLFTYNTKTERQLANRNWRENNEVLLDNVSLANLWSTAIISDATMFTFRSSDLRGETFESSSNFFVTDVTV